MTAILSAVILFLAFYTSGFELAFREVRDTASHLIRYAVGNQFAPRSSSELSVQTPILRPQIEPQSIAGDAVELPVEAAELLKDQEADLRAEPTLDLEASSQTAQESEVSTPAVDKGALAAAATASDEQVFLVRFGFDSAELDDDSLTTIQRATHAMHDGFEGVAVVAGYSDPLGNSAYNLKLSIKRAQAVADSLLASGVSQDRLRVEGRGSYSPLEVTANPPPIELGRIAQIIIDESGEW